MTWRLLVENPAGGAWNMALDEAIAGAVGRGHVPPTFRLYGWRVPTVSLGYAQPWKTAPDLDVCRGRGIEIVRRPTGGRALLHAAEITYSVCVPLAGDWAGLSVTDSFGRISAALIAGLRRVGIDAQIGTGPRGAAQRPSACFQLAGIPAIVVGARKLVGSAQRRWDTGLLQHGSILIHFDPGLHAALFPDWNEAAAERVTCLAALAPGIDRQTVEAALMAGWSEVLGPGASGTLTPDERTEAQRLVRYRYGNADWTFRR